MPYVPPPLAEVHSSDSDCLARLRAERLTRFPDGEGALIGTLAHRSIELYTYRRAEVSDYDPMLAVREVLREHAADPGMTAHVIGETLRVMAGAFGPNSTLEFGLRDGWSVAPEWAWYMNSEFEPVGKDDSPAYAGRCDRLSWNEKTGAIEIADWKSILARMSREDAKTAWQAQMYALAVLQHFPEAKKVTFAFVLLRHGYSARAEFKRADPWFEQTKTRLRTMYERRLKAIETGTYPEEIGPACSWCPVIHRCKAQDAARLEGFRSDLTPPEMANRYLGMREIVKQYDGFLRAEVKRTEKGIPLGDGSVLGMKPVPDLVLWPGRTYEQTLADIDAMGCSPEQRIEWWRFVTKDNFPSRVKKAMETLVGRSTARSLIEAGGWLDTNTAFEFSVHEPAPVEEKPEGKFDEPLADMIDRLIAEDPDRVRRAADALKW